MKVLIIDFNDSFTYNISSLLEEWNIEHKVINEKDISLDLIQKEKPKSIIWGPGPGHPCEYHGALELIKELIEKENIFHIGVCLGHQLLLKYYGFQLEEAKEKLHGRSIDFEVPHWEMFDPCYFGKKLPVQFYNSLIIKAPSRHESIKFLEKDGVILSSMGSNLLTFQFHPESVGTSCPEVFFHGWRKLLIQ